MAEAEDVRRIIEDTFKDAELEWESPEPGSYVVKLPGTRKLFTTLSLRAGRHSLSLNAFVIRHPDENEAGVHRWLLERNLKLYGVSYAVDGLGDIYLAGEAPALRRHARRTRPAARLGPGGRGRRFQHAPGAGLRVGDPARVRVAGLAGRVDPEPRRVQEPDPEADQVGRLARRRKYLPTDLFPQGASSAMLTPDADLNTVHIRERFRGMALSRRQFVGGAVAVAGAAGTTGFSRPTRPAGLWEEFEATPYTHPQIPYVGRAGAHGGARRSPRPRVVANALAHGATPDARRGTTDVHGTDSAPAINRALAEAGSAAAARSCCRRARTGSTTTSGSATAASSCAARAPAARSCSPPGTSPN